jgi:hypothetical protein
MPCDPVLLDVRGAAVLALCAVALLAAPGQPPAQAAPASGSITATDTAVVLQNQACRWEIGLNGQNLAFINRADQTNYCDPGQPFMQVQALGQLAPATAVALSGDVATVSFGASGLQVQVKLEAFPERFALTVLEITGGDPDWLQLANLRLKITAHVGPLVNAAWDDQFGACVMACNDQVDAHGADGSHAHLTARSYREYGFKGARIAVLGVPTGGPDQRGLDQAGPRTLRLLPDGLRHGRGGH